MATHAHSTRTPLLRPVGSPQPLLGQGLGRQPGPVTQAIRAMRAAEPLPPADAAIEAIREGLIRFFVEDDGADRQRVRELRRRIADRIEADLALLNALGGDPDAEPSLGAPEPLGSNYRFVAPDGLAYFADDQARWGAGNTDDQEHDAGSDREEENEHGADDDAGEPELNEAWLQPLSMGGGGFWEGRFGRRA